MGQNNNEALSFENVLYNYSEDDVTLPGKTRISDNGLANHGSNGFISTHSENGMTGMVNPYAEIPEEKKKIPDDIPFSKVDLKGQDENADIPFGSRVDLKTPDKNAVVVGIGGTKGECPNYIKSEKGMITMVNPVYDFPDFDPDIVSESQKSQAEDQPPLFKIHRGEAALKPELPLIENDDDFPKDSTA